MPTYKLTYFNARGRGQNARLLFKLAGVEFEDHRIEMADWPAYKPKTPFGSMPILTVDGKTELTQAKAIGRYLARELGFYGKTNLECAEIDCVMDMVEDVYEGVGKIMGAKGDEAKMAAVADYKKGVAKMFSNLEKKLSQCNDGKDFFVGKKITVADIFAYSAMGSAITFSGGDESILADFSKLSSLRTRVGENKNIADWVALRPQSSF